MHKIFTETLFTGKCIRYLPSCHSTNDSASAMLAAEKISEGTVVITDHQLKGKGQRGNHWESQPGENLTFSVVLKPTFVLVSAQFDLNLVISLALADTLNDYGLKDVIIKWPNDIYCSGKKIAGILIENSVKSNLITSSIIGIGLNVNQTSFEEKWATSISLVTGKAIEKHDLLGRLLLFIEKRYLELKNGGANKLKEAYLDRLYQMNIWKEYEAPAYFEGKIIGIDAFGRLIVQKRNGEVNCYGIKEIEFIRT